jgi:hypothetical protein
VTAKLAGDFPPCTASKLIAWRLTWGLYDQLRCLVVLVDHATEHFASLDWQVQRWADLAVLVGWSLLAGLVRAVPVVMAGVLVPLEYSIAWLTCAFASGQGVVMVGWPGATQDRLPASSPDIRPRCPGAP